MYLSCIFLRAMDLDIMSLASSGKVSLAVLYHAMISSASYMIERDGVCEGLIV